MTYLNFCREIAELQFASSYDHFLLLSLQFVINHHHHSIRWHIIWDTAWIRVAGFESEADVLWGNENVGRHRTEGWVGFCPWGVVDTWRREKCSPTSSQSPFVQSHIWTARGWVTMWAKRLVPSKARSIRCTEPSTYLSKHIKWSLVWRTKSRQQQFGYLSCPSRKIL